MNDRQKGHTDEYTGESVLGTCFLFDLGKPSAIEVIIDEYDDGDDDDDDNYDNLDFLFFGR